jgi:signal peptidase I
MSVTSRKSLVELIKTVAIVAVLFFGVRAAVMPRIVLGQSMEPTLRTNEWVLLERVSYWLHGPERGDIVVFKAPDNPSEDYIKRVIGLPGDHVVVRDGHVAINGHVLTENYTAAAPDYVDDRVVPQGYVYVLGDNRDNSDDSHIWGLLPERNIVGEAVAVYWPLSNLSFLPHPGYGVVR